MVTLLGVEIIFLLNSKMEELCGIFLNAVVENWTVREYSTMSVRGNLSDATI